MVEDADMMRNFEIFSHSIARGKVEGILELYTHVRAEEFSLQSSPWEAGRLLVWVLDSVSSVKNWAQWRMEYGVEEKTRIQHFCATWEKVVLPLKILGLPRTWDELGPEPVVKTPSRVQRFLRRKKKTVQENPASTEEIMRQMRRAENIYALNSQKEKFANLRIENIAEADLLNNLAETVLTWCENHVAQEKDTVVYDHYKALEEYVEVRQEQEKRGVELVLGETHQGGRIFDENTVLIHSVCTVKPLKGAKITLSLLPGNLVAHANAQFAPRRLRSVGFEVLKLTQGDLYTALKLHSENTEIEFETCVEMVKHL